MGLTRYKGWVHKECCILGAMINESLRRLLTGGDLRSIAGSDDAVNMVKNQHDFDELISFIFDSDRLLAMRAVDAVEKITRLHPEYLVTHAEDIVELVEVANHKELKWHLALLLARLDLQEDTRVQALSVLKTWLCDARESTIVRVNSLQALYDMGEDCSQYLPQNIPPALRARAKKLIEE